MSAIIGLGCDVCDIGMREFAPTFDEWEDKERFDNVEMDGFGIKDRDGNVITYAKWVWLMEFNHGYKIVKHDHFGNGESMVSTVWLGLSASSGYIFETMIFGIDGFEYYQERYTNEADAILGHKHALSLVRKRG